MHKLVALGVAGIDSGIPAVLDNSLIDSRLNDQGDKESPEDDGAYATHEGRLGTPATIITVVIFVFKCLFSDDATAAADKQA